MLCLEERTEWPVLLTQSIGNWDHTYWKNTNSKSIHVPSNQLFELLSCSFFLQQDIRERESAMGMNKRIKHDKSTHIIFYQFSTYFTAFFIDYQHFNIICLYIYIYTIMHFYIIFVVSFSQFWLLTMIQLVIVIFSCIINILVIMQIK